MFYSVWYVGVYWEFAGLSIRCNILGINILDTVLSPDAVEVFPLRAGGVCKNAQLAAAC